MYPRLRSPFVSWLLTAMTGGAYLPFWVWRVAREMNAAEKREVLRANLWRKVFGWLIAVMLVGFLVAIQTRNPAVLMVVALCFLAFALHVQISVGNYIKAKDSELGTREHYSQTVSVLLLWLVAGTGVAYMQAGINRVIRYERARS